MRLPRTFTAALVQHLLREPDTASVVHEWLTVEADIEKREIDFAAALAEDFIEPLERSGIEDDSFNCLWRVVMRTAYARVNWRRVSRALLRHFTLPLIVASSATNGWREDSERAPAVWRGALN